MPYYLWYVPFLPSQYFSLDLYALEELEDWRCGTELTSDAYEETAEYTVLPLENTIYGPVTETLDCFFGRFNCSGTNHGQGDGDRKGKGKEKEIIATLDLPIRHCLVVKRGTKMEDIRIVSSHEQVSVILLVPLDSACSSIRIQIGRGIQADTQALGQSSTFLNTNLPNAKRIAVASTALAAESLLSPIPSDEGARAAICSKSVIEIYPELEVLYEGTQDRSGLSFPSSSFSLPLSQLA